MPTKPTAEALILSVRPLEVATVARLMPRIRAAYADRRGNRQPLSPGQAAQEARAVTTEAAIRAEPDPDARRELAECRDALRRVDAVYWQVVAGWERAAQQVARQGMARMRRDTTPPAKEDLMQDARFGLWRGILRWEPDAGSCAYTWSWRWALATAQRGHLANDLDGLKSVKGWRVDARVVARRLDAPLSVDQGGKPDDRLLGDTLAAPEADDTEERWADARRQIAALLPTLEPREREIAEAYLRAENPTLRGAGNEVGISRERVRQIFAGIAKRKGRAKPPPPPNLVTDILNHLSTASRPSTVRELANRLGTSDRAVKRALDNLCADGVAAPVSAKRAHGAVAYVQKEPDMPNDSAPRVLSREVVLPVLIAHPNATPAELAAALGGLSAADTDRAEAQASWLRTTGQVPGIAPSGLAKRILGYLATHPGATSADIAEATGAQIKSIQRAASGLEYAHLVAVRGRPARYYLPTPEPAPMPAPTDPAPTSEPTPTPAPTDPTPASISVADLAAALGIEDTDATPAELLDAVRALNRPRPDPRVAHLERQIADLNMDLADYCKTIEKIDAKLTAAKAEASTLAASLNEMTRRANDSDRDLQMCRMELAEAEREITRWRDAYTAIANAPAPSLALTRADLERRIDLWVKADNVEHQAAFAADLPGLLDGEAEVLRDHRLSVAAQMRARALRGQVCDAE